MAFVETVESIKKLRAIEHMQVAISELQRYQVSPVIVNSVIAVYESMVSEYNEAYLGQDKVQEHATTNPERQKPSQQKS